MSEDFILKYTNNFANKAKEKLDDELKIDGECKITNYDPRVTDGKKKGHITINFSADEQTIENGIGNSKSRAEKADFSEKKYSIFREIAALDNNDGELSISDIKKIDKEKCIKEWGLQNIRLDFKNGVATLIWGENDILRIDFSNITKSTKATPSTEVKEAPKATQTSSSTQPQAKNIEDAYKETYSLIPKEYDKYIKQVAKNAGVSEDLVKTFIINEGQVGTKEAALTAYKRSGDVWTIGFGHTNLCREMNFKVKDGVTITLDEAFELLEGDIKEMKKYASRSVGIGNFENSPQSIQGLFIEYCFQNGPGGKLKSANMKANLSGKYYNAIAAGSLFDGNYNRRSVYRFMLAISDLSTTDKQDALKRLKNKGNYNKMLASLSGTEKMLFKNFCKQIEVGA